jgi:hypothetical protein
MLQPAVRRPELQVAGGEGADEDHRLAFWLMLMKPPAPASRGPNLLTLTLPSRVGLRQAEEGEVEPAAVVEVELVGLVDDRLRC